MAMDHSSIRKDDEDEERDQRDDRDDVFAGPPEKQRRIDEHNNRLVNKFRESNYPMSVLQ